jgi:4-diphosphocytidyl-2-C-methyl-D-erythritol kinase
VRHTPLRVPSFAKINWYLQVLGKRPDGYHEVVTVLQTISLHDELGFELVEDGAISLECNDPEIPTDDRNLVVKAALLLKARFNLKLGVHVTLHKRIPAKAGLGGASANAAVSLFALAHLWNLQVSSREFFEMATFLGADVPFFLVGGCGLATGIGATVSPVSDQISGPVRQVIVITPAASVSTADAYTALNCDALTTSKSNPILSSSRIESDLLNSQPWSRSDSLRNDFEPVIFDIEPEIRRAKEALIQAGADAALLAGSGSSVFGIFAGEKEQQRARDQIQPEPGWRVFPCGTLSRNEYRNALGDWAVPFLRSFNSEDDLGA